MPNTSSELTNTFTDALLAQLVANNAERVAIAASVAATLETGEGWIDSHKVADIIFEHRSADGTRDVNWTQTKDYTQHVFREAENVCRYADGTLYRIHKDTECSADCQSKRTAEKRIDYGLCATCFIAVNAFGECSMCGDC